MLLNRKCFHNMASAVSQPEGYFSVTPKTDCPHVQVIKQTDSLKIDASAPCLTCGDTKENWLCLVCSEVHCSRFAKGDMVKHNEDTNHAITLSFTDLSVWCYECDSCIDSPCLKEISRLVKVQLESLKEIPLTTSSLIKKQNANPSNGSSLDTTTEKLTTAFAEKPEGVLPKNEAKAILVEKTGSENSGDTMSAKLMEHGSREGDLTSSLQSSGTNPRGVMSDDIRSGRQGESGATALSRSEKAGQDMGTVQLVNQIKGIIYGNCIGDAIGLLTEFMDKEMATKYYGTSRLMSVFRTTQLEYDQKHDDRHRCNWVQGDWTDDSDQMILILRTLLKNDGRFDELDFAARLKRWVRYGYPELGDTGGCGLGRTTASVLSHNHYLKDPHKAARIIWEESGRFIAPNGGVMRTSILGTMEFHDLKKVIANTKNACMVTHADPRCIASCVAVTVAIALMLQGKHTLNNGEYDVEGIMSVAHGYAQEEIEDKNHKKELTEHMFADSLEDLELDESRAIGYTLKCLGAGFWAFRQKDFRDAIQKITMEAGDADTNCAVAGALLGCKVGFSNLPQSWITGLANREWLDSHINSYLALLGLKSPGSFGHL